MTKRMAEAAFRDDQRARLREPHIAPITDLIDSLRTSERWLPYVAPLHGGIKARMLTIQQDPGRATLDESGSGMLCVENDDQTAAMQFQLMEAAGLKPSDFTPWNAYPWFIDRSPTDAELRDASPALIALLDLLPNLEVLMLQGGEAQKAWRLALDEQPSLRRRRLIALETYHPSVQALRAKGEERQRRIQHRVDTWREAADILNN